MCREDSSSGRFTDEQSNLLPFTFIRLLHLTYAVLRRTARAPRMLSVDPWTWTARGRTQPQPTERHPSADALSAPPAGRGTHPPRPQAAGSVQSSRQWPGLVVERRPCDRPASMCDRRSERTVKEPDVGRSERRSHIESLADGLHILRSIPSVKAVKRLPWQSARPRERPSWRLRRPVLAAVGSHRPTEPTARRPEIGGAVGGPRGRL